MPQYPASIDLQTLTGNAGYTFRSTVTNDWLGYSIHLVGDVNGDFITDFLIGAPGEDPLPLAAVTHTSPGKAFLVFGGTANLAVLDAADGVVDNVINPANLNGTTGYTFQGITNGDQTGASVWGGSDLDDDGDADLLIGSPSFTGSAANGSVFLISGGAANLAALDAADGSTNGVIQLSNAATGGYRITGVASGERAGFSVSSVHDLNGDGVSDFLIGAPLAATPTATAGEAYLVFGGNGLEALDTADGNNDNDIGLSNLSSATGYTFFRTVVDDQAGIAVAGISDVNGDGITDLLIGSWFANPNGNNSGSTFIVFGGAANFAALDVAGGGALDGRIDLSAVNGTTGYVFDGAVANDRVGLGLAATDINGDGIADLILGAYLADPAPGANAGEAYIVFGGAANLAATDAADGSTNGHLSPASLDGTRGYRIVAENGVDWMGYSIAAAGDVNGDGFNDVILGVNYGDSGGNRSGDTFIVFGGTSNLAAWDALDGSTNGVLDVHFLDGTNGFRLQGVDIGDQSGVSVSSAGDLNFDGLADILVGAPRANDPVEAPPPAVVNPAGEAYVVFGRLPDAAVNRTGTAQAQNLVGGNFNDTLTGLGGNDALYGHGGEDLLDGGANDDLLLGGDDDDVLAGRGGDDTMMGDDGNDVLNGGGGGDSMTGGLGDDLYVVDSASDVIFENSGGGTDKVKSFVDYELGAGSDVEILYAAVGSPGLTLTGNEIANRIYGDANGDRLLGAAGNDTLVGNAGDDVLNGGGDDDKLYGGDNDDTLAGGGGRDFLTGDGGNDTFLYANVSDSGITGATRDQILDFQIGSDTIDLSQIDSGAVGGAFNFVGSGPLQNAGDLQVTEVNGNMLVSADVNGDQTADFQILVRGSLALSAGDFVL